MALGEMGLEIISPFVSDPSPEGRGLSEPSGGPELTRLSLFGDYVMAVTTSWDARPDPGRVVQC